MTFEPEVDDNHDSYDDPKLICPRCLDKATKLCDGCKNIRYCSPECQQADRPAHKLLCRTYDSFTQRPSTSGMCRIVVLLPDEKIPRLTWAPLSLSIAGRNRENERYSEDIDMNDIIEVTAQQSFRAAYTCKNAWTGDPLSRTIKVVFDDNFIANYENKNQAVQAATQGMDDVGWRGPIIAFCGSLGGGDCGLDLEKVYDMDMQDYSYLVGFLIGYRNKTAQQAARIGPKVECVKVACKGDREVGLPFHQVVRVPRSHPIFVGEGAMSEVSEVNTPLKLEYRYRISSECNNPNTMSSETLHAVAHLAMSQCSALLEQPADHPHAHLLRSGSGRRHARSESSFLRPSFNALSARRGHTSRCPAVKRTSPCRYRGSLR